MTPRHDAPRDSRKLLHRMACLSVLLTAAHAVVALSWLWAGMLGDAALEYLVQRRRERAERQ